MEFQLALNWILNLVKIVIKDLVCCLEAWQNFYSGWLLFLGDQWNINLVEREKKKMFDSREI